DARGSGIVGIDFERAVTRLGRFFEPSQRPKLVSSHNPCGGGLQIGGIDWEVRPHSKSFQDGIALRPDSHLSGLEYDRLFITRDRFFVALKTGECVAEPIPGCPILVIRD